MPDEHSEFARAAGAVAAEEGLMVPALWPYEVQNGLAMALRRNRIDPDSVSDALDALRGLGAELEAPQGLGHELRLAQANGLTAYDAAYLAVALNSGATLATSDQRLRLVAQRLGVALFAGTHAKSRTPRGKRR